METTIWTQMRGFILVALMVIITLTMLVAGAILAAGAIFAVTDEGSIYPVDMSH